MLGDRGGPKVSLFQNCVIPCARVSPSNVGSGVKLGSAGGHDKHLRSYHVGLERVCPHFRLIGVYSWKPKQASLSAFAVLMLRRAPDRPAFCFSGFRLPSSSQLSGSLCPRCLTVSGCAWYGPIFVDFIEHLVSHFNLET